MGAMLVFVLFLFFACVYDILVCLYYCVLPLGAVVNCL